MKRILTIMAAIICLCSCEETILDGAWDPMELDKTHVNFPSEGGQNTVSVLNYNSWWIAGGYDVAELVDNQWEYSGYVYATSSDGEGANTSDILEGSWYHVTVPNKGQSNTIIITVDPLGDSKARQAMIEMQAGNTFARISLQQN